jgi:sugar/nucleoside kinase (ribokinase family)
MSEMPAPCEVVTVGSATQDVFVTTRDINVMRLQSYDDEDAFFAIPYGAKIDVEEMFITTGGGGTNTGVTFKRFGLTTSVLAKVGDDRSGRLIRERLKEEGIDDSLVVVDPDHRTGYSAIIMGFTEERTVLVYRGATLYLHDDDIDTDRLRQAGMIFVGSLSGETARLYPMIAALCANRGIFLAANPGGTQFRAGLDAFRDVMQHLDVVFLNKEEAYTFTGIEPKRGGHDEREMLRIMHEAGAKRVVITEGAKGCQALDDEAYYSVPACKANVVSTLGAGDAFASGCAAALFKGEPLERALRYGAVNAAGVVQNIGAKRGILRWDAATRAVDDWDRCADEAQS